MNVLKRRGSAIHTARVACEYKPRIIILRILDTTWQWNVGTNVGIGPHLDGDVRKTTILVGEAIIPYGCDHTQGPAHTPNVELGRH